MRKKLKVLIIFFLLITPAQSFALGEAAILKIQLSDIAKDLKVQIMKSIQLIKEATIQSKTVIETRDLAINMKKNYDFIKNFNFENYMQDFVNGIEGITLLDNLKGKDFDRQFDLVMREIDRRFTSEEEKSNYKNLCGDLKKLWTLQQVKANENTAIVKGNTNHANNVATTASNTGLAIILASKKEQRDVIHDHQEKFKDQYMESLVNDACKSMNNKE